MKSINYISWDEYFMAVAMLSSKRSKDPSTKVGCCIVGENDRIVGCGYNGMPNGCNDDEMNWDREGEGIQNKYFYVVHAEANAILNSERGLLKGATLYTTLFPCNECAKLIVQAGIQEVVYFSNKYNSSDSTKASTFILDKANIKYREFNSQLIKQLEVL